GRRQRLGPRNRRVERPVHEPPAERPRVGRSRALRGLPGLLHPLPAAPWGRRVPAPGRRWWDRPRLVSPPRLLVLISRRFHRYKTPKQTPKLRFPTGVTNVPRSSRKRGLTPPYTGDILAVTLYILWCPRGYPHQARGRRPVSTIYQPAFHRF